MQGRFSRRPCSFLCLSKSLNFPHLSDVQPEPIDFPNYSLRFRQNAGRREIFDLVRKKFVALTPEEIVRQHFIYYLHEEQDVPLSLMSVEKSLKLHGMIRRCDIVVYNREGQPVMIVECKAPEVALNQAVLDQAARYNLKLQVPYLLVSNGHEYYCCKINRQQQDVDFLEAIPSFVEMGL